MKLKSLILIGLSWGLKDLFVIVKNLLLFWDGMVFSLRRPSVALNRQIPALPAVPCRSSAVSSCAFNHLKVPDSQHQREIFHQSGPVSTIQRLRLTDFIQRDCGYLIWEKVQMMNPWSNMCKRVSCLLTAPGYFTSNGFMRCVTELFFNMTLAWGVKSLLQCCPVVFPSRSIAHV